MEAAQPLLRWAGSKRQIVPLLAKYWSGEFKRYVEPFAGSACLFFHLAPRVALLGDINAELLSTYQSVKLRYSEVSKLLCKMPKGEREYYKVRALRPEGLSSVARAARFIYLNRYCFNGLYRTNGNGDFNVPYGGRGSGSIPSAETLKRISLLLKRATLINEDFEKVLDRVTHGDFVYMDPPFSVCDRRVFKEYGSKVFGWKDIIRLRKRLVGLAEGRIPFVVSYIRSEEAEYLAKGFKVSSVSVRRNISGFLESRVKCQELLISNPA